MLDSARKRKTTQSEMEETKSHETPPRKTNSKINDLSGLAAPEM